MRIGTALLMACYLFCLAGCGGGGSSQTTPVTVEIGWGARGRVVNGPSSALSVIVTLNNADPSGGNFTWTINRDSSTLPAYTGRYTSVAHAKVGSTQAIVRFYAQQNGTGAMVGVAEANVTIHTDGTGIGDIATMDTIASVEVPPGQSVAVDQIKDLVFVPRDASTAEVAVTPGSAFFSITSGSDRLQTV